MNTKQLLQFTSVAHAGSITEAAQRLHIAQPALSHAISNLEEDLGVHLFERHRRGVTLTDAGAVLLDHAQTILRQIEYAREAVLGREETPSGPVGIALPASAAHAICRLMCEAVLERLPQVKLAFDEGLTGNLTRFLRSGRIDMMVDFDVERSDEFVTEPLIREDLYLFGRDLDGSGNIPYRQLERYPLFLPAPEHAMGRAVTRYESEMGNELRRIPMDIGVHPMLELVRAGLGYTISPWSLLHDKVGKGNLSARKIVDPPMHRTAYLVFLRARLQSSAAKAVADILREAVVLAHSENEWRGELIVE